MIESFKRPKIIGSFIREKREKLGLSQKSLGLLFNPSVTTQFISNLERGVTPLPPVHLSTLAKALEVTEVDLMNLLEQEYTLKLSGRAKADDPDYDFIRNLYAAYRQADAKTKEAFASVCQSILNFAEDPEKMTSEAVE